MRLTYRLDLSVLFPLQFLSSEQEILFWAQFFRRTNFSLPRHWFFVDGEVSHPVLQSCSCFYWRSICLRICSFLGFPFLSLKFAPTTLKMLLLPFLVCFPFLFLFPLPIFIFNVHSFKVFRQAV